jgi:hypothetical protein
MMGKEICTDYIPTCHVGQDPRQGDLRISESYKDVIKKAHELDTQKD